mgnify:FL=1
MHQTKYRGIITEGRIIDVSSLGASGFPLVKPLRKSVNPFGGDLCFGWLGSLRLYLYKPLGCVSTLWKWMPAGKQYKSVFYIVDKNKIIRYFLRMKNSVG